MCIGNIVVGISISQFINNKIYEICRYIAGERYVKDKEKKLSLPEGIKILSFIFKWKSVLNSVCGLLFFVIGYYLFSGWYTFIFIIISTYQFSQSIKDFDLFSNKKKIEDMARCGLLI
uniref:Uncharacterized protein n=1 Tax=Mimivirus LCMiAC02 TaxID=2506609 RepID=A0A4D5XFB1_9VIRU|nr:MAG: hypothetical protein LCMiAC02_03170 [Mimivirus LCMiAC02]